MLRENSVDSKERDQHGYTAMELMGKEENAAMMGLFEGWLEWREYREILCTSSTETGC